MGTSSTAMMAAGVGMSAVGGYQSASAQRSALNYDATVNDNNAQIATYQAQVAESVGQRQEQSSRLQTASLYGTQRAAMAASGVDLGEGSANDVLTSTEVMGERDALTIRDNTAQRVWAQQQEAAGFTARANASRAAASGISPGMAGAASLLGGAGQVASSWYQAKYSYRRGIE